MKVLIVCHVRLYREGLQRILGENSRVEVVGAVKDGRLAIQQIRELRPDIVLLDVAIPDALMTLKNLVPDAPHCKVVALGIDEPSADVIACAEAGVSGFVFLDDPLDDLVNTLQSAHCGKLRCSQRVAGMLLKRVSALATIHVPSSSNVPFTRREHQIARLLSEGLSNKQIASRLDIEVATVKNHVHSILAKLHVHSRGEATTRIRQLGTGQHSVGLVNI